MENLKCQSNKKIFGSKKMLMILVVMILAITFIIFSFSFDHVFALQSTSSAEKIGELWNSTNQEFNQSNVLALYSKLFGDQNPVEYINANKSDRELERTGSKVVQAETINKQVGKPDDGLVVTLGGLEWMVASLTLADTNGKKDNVVMTLYLANNLGASKYLDTTIDTSGSDSKNRGKNMYSASTVRQHLLTASTWSLFSSGYFAEEFLVKPKYINYQVNQVRATRDNGDDLKNEAIGTPDDLKWYSGYNYNWPNDNRVEANGLHTPYTSSEKYNGHRYDDWGDDYIWLPSMTEVGGYKEGNNPGYSYLADSTNNIWGLSQKQRQHTGTNSSGNLGTEDPAARWSWFRSGNGSSYCASCVLGASGSCNGSVVSNSYGVRPALHLNLSSAVLGTAYGVVPTEDSGYDYQSIVDGVRQNYAILNYKHGISDKQVKSVIGNVAPETKVADFVKNLTNDKQNIVIKNGDKTIYNKGSGDENAVVGTGYAVELYNGNQIVETVYISVLGDVTGDGRIDATDITYLRRIANGEVALGDLSKAVQLAAMVDNRGKVTSIDAEILRAICKYETTIDKYF